jgi:hypothetical protein
VNRRFKFQKRGQFFIRSHNETLFVAAMRVSNAKFFGRSANAVIRVYDAIAASANRRFQFRNRNQLIIRAHNAPLPVAAMGVSNPDCSPFTIHR